MGDLSLNTKVGGKTGEIQIKNFVNSNIPKLMF